MSEPANLLFLGGGLATPTMPDRFAKFWRN
jgi:hypothetical protein